jgi:hypothetical protein
MLGAGLPGATTVQPAAYDKRTVQRAQTHTHTHAHANTWWESKPGGVVCTLGWRAR